jgi:hypothetical protein
LANKPFFVEGDDHFSGFGVKFFTMQDLNKTLPDIMLKMSTIFQANNHYYEMLCFVFSGINGMPLCENVGSLPISNYHPKKTYALIVKLCLEIIERAVLKNKELAATSILKTMDLINPYLKTTYFDEKDINDNSNKKNISKTLMDLLVTYHNLYDGRYKVSLSCFHYLIDVIYGLDNRNFDKYLEDDVSFKIKQIEKTDIKRVFIDTPEWLLIGVDEHIRNAVAHKRWNFIESYVELSDRSGWEKKFGFFQIEDLYRSLKIANRAMESALIISVVQHLDIFKKYFKRKELDRETLHIMLYNLAKKYRFVLEKFSISNNSQINCELKSEPQTIGPEEVIIGGKYGSFKYKMPEMKEPIERAKSLINELMNMITNYDVIELSLYNFCKVYLGKLQFNLKDYFSNTNEHSKDNDFNNYFTFIPPDK